ncbi:MAG: hypothetical protein JO103_13490 [Candidatus Eremiobacteraeota bacterium]|nr:hypothetical protein [Candidatus Eremiobacteraeota bacterium]
MIRRLDPDRLLPWLCVTAVVGRLIAVAIAFPPQDGDRIWQRWLGERILHEHAIPRALGPETFAAAGAPWTPQEWLFSTALAASTDHGLTWLVPLACALLVGVALVAVVLRCARRGLSAAATSGAVLLCSLATIQSFGTRVQVVGWAGVALLLWLLEIEGPLAWAAVPLTLVWANLHASVFLAPLVVLLVAFAAALRDRGFSPAVRRYAMIAAACALATTLTPLGLDLPRYAVGLLTSPIRHAISEWGATSLNSAAFTLGALPLVLALVAYGVRAPLRDRLVALAFGVLLFTAVRNVPVFAFAVAPIALAALPRAGARVVVPTRSVRAAAWVTVAAAALVAVIVPIASWRNAPSAASELPVGPVRALLAQSAAPPRVFCEDFAWCSLFLEERRPARFFMDGRCDPYPPRLWREYLTVLNGNTGWRRVLDAHRVDAVIVRRDGALDSLLAERPEGWYPIAADGRARVYVRPSLLARAAR